MIVVDSSVWIDQLRDKDSVSVRKLRSAPQSEIIVGDLVLLEVLRGAANDRQAAFIESQLRLYTSASMLDHDLAATAARNYRHLRGLGITPRRTADLIIGTFCIENDHLLLHSDRNFDHMRQHLGLSVF